MVGGGSSRVPVHHMLADRQTADGLTFPGSIFCTSLVVIGGCENRLKPDSGRRRPRRRHVVRHGLRASVRTNCSPGCVCSRGMLLHRSPPCRHPAFMRRLGSVASLLLHIVFVVWRTGLRRAEITSARSPPRAVRFHKLDSCLSHLRAFALKQIEL